MQIAKVNVAAPVYVPSGEYLDGAVLAEPAWARRGQHTMSAEFARTQDAAGMLEIESIDGAQFMWAACCSDSFCPVFVTAKFLQSPATAISRT